MMQGDRMMQGHHNLLKLGGNLGSLKKPGKSEDVGKSKETQRPDGKGRP